MAKKQIGFPLPTSNFYQVPNSFIDIIAEIKNLGEIKVLNYLLRHTWGYHEFDIPKKITLDEFMHGRASTKDKAKIRGYEFRKGKYRIDKGTKLNKQTIINGLKSMVKDGYGVEYISNEKDPARLEKSYMLIIQGQPVYREIDGARLTEFSIEHLTKLGYIENSEGDYILPDDKEENIQHIDKSVTNRATHWGTDIVPQNIVENSQDNSQDVGVQQLNPGGTSIVHRSEKDTTENVVVVQDENKNYQDREIERIICKVYSETGCMVDKNWVQTMLSKWNIEYIFEKIELASNSKIDKNIAGFIYDACKNDWNHTGPKKYRSESSGTGQSSRAQKENTDEEKKKFLRSLYT